MSLKDWWTGVTLGDAEPVPAPELIPLDLDARNAPEEVRDAAKVVLDWLAEEVDDTVETIEITRDQWEGLQFELSELKSQMVEVQAKLGVNQPTFPPLPEDFSIGNDLYDQEFEDWTLDVNWEERVAVDVTIRGGPEGLYMGPFVLLAPEERDAILQANTVAFAEADKSFRVMNDRHRERESDLEAVIKHRNSEIEECGRMLAEANRREMRRDEIERPSWADIAGAE